VGGEEAGYLAIEVDIFSGGGEGDADDVFAFDQA